MQSINRFLIYVLVILFYGFANSLFAQDNKPPKVYTLVAEVKKLEAAITQEIIVENQIALAYKLGETYFTLGSYHNAIKVLEQNLSHPEAAQLQNSEWMAKTHLLLADIYERMGVMDSFLEHIYLFNKYYRLSFADVAIYDALYYSYVSRYYSLRMIFDKGLEYSNKSMRILHKHSEDAHRIPQHKIYTNHTLSLRNVPATFQERQNYADSIQDLLDKVYTSFHPEVAFHRISNKLFVLDSADIYHHTLNKDLEPFHNPMAKTIAVDIQKEVALLTKHFGEHHPVTAKFNALTGLLYYYQNDFDQSIYYYDLAIKQLTANHLFDADMISPYIAMLASTYLWKSWSLTKKYEKEGNLDYLLENEKIFIHLGKVWHFYVEGVIKNNHSFNEFQYLRNPYAHIQKNYIKLYNHTKNNAYKSNILQTGQLSRHYSLTHIFDKKINSQNAANREDYIHIENLFLAKYSNDNIDKDFYKAFYEQLDQRVSKRIHNVNDIQQIQNQLASNEAVVLFSNYDIDKKIHLLTQVILKDKDTLFTDNLNKFIFFGTNDNKSPMFETILKENVEDFQTTSHHNYLNYFQSIRNFIGSNVKSLKIVKSPFLENLHIPFELLISEPINSKSFKNLNYLGQSYDISYPFENKLLASLSKKKPEKITVFIAENKDLEPFTYTNQFVKNLRNKYKLNVIKGEKATKEELLKTLREDTFVIIVSHGIGNRSYDLDEKGIYLYDGLLSYNEIYDINLNESTIVLAGCSTGVGFRSNEGSINFVRPFAFAGASSLLITDWDVDEKSTLTIIEDWLYYLSKGHSKSKSLSLAQKSYIENATSRLSNPLYWGAFRIMGDDGPVVIPLQKKTYQHLILVGIGILVAGLFFFIKFK